MKKLYTASKNKTRSWLCLRSWSPYCQIQAYIEETRENTRPFKFNLNQIPYDYIVEMRNKFKALDLIDIVPEELWTEVCDTVKEAVLKTIPRKRNIKSQNGCLRRPYK